MQPVRMTGPGAGVHKYDILTALAIAGLHGSTVQQVSALRLIALITARYNWQRNELSIGQAEMARIWGVDPRTAKREVKRLVASGLLEIVRAGVRGRVASYRLNLAVLEERSRPVWECVGPDFADRAGRLLAQRAGREAPGNVLRVDFAGPRAPEAAGQGVDPRWQAVLERLAAESPEDFANWYQRLSLAGCEGGAVCLHAPNAFVTSYVATHLAAPLEAAVTQVFGAGHRVSLRAG
ncbi:DnaA N-terminal domain-containing protein [Meridianimarinicoccus zhengii]|uniref:DnaA N-terminal domain-containing protein n=1 Tax=Meridianimarinicoccus zhengii TaxID=2056810 RepID=UPI000DAE7E6A|nr:MarR family winged helix-turn-helix transcriptional regulator [Phycocomes zhengii]